MWINNSHLYFSSEMKLDSAATSSLEDRVKRNIYSIQRTAASLDNFMKRWRHSSFARTDLAEMARRERANHFFLCGCDRNEADIFCWDGVFKSRLNQYEFKQGLCISIPKHDLYFEKYFSNNGKATSFSFKCKRFTLTVYISSYLNFVQ